MPSDPVSDSFDLDALREPWTAEHFDMLEAAAKAASRGQWSCWNGWGPVQGTDLLAMTRIGPKDGDGGIYADVDGATDKDFYATRADAEYVAMACPDVVLELVGIVADLRRQVDEARAENEHLRADFDSLLTQHRSEMNHYMGENADLRRQVAQARAENERLNAYWPNVYATKVQEERAENERHEKANLVRAVLDGYGPVDEFITEAINRDDFDRVPWGVSVKLADEVRRLRTAMKDAADLLMAGPIEVVHVAVARDLRAALEGEAET